MALQAAWAALGQPHEYNGPDEREARDRVAEVGHCAPNTPGERDSALRPPLADEKLEKLEGACDHIAWSSNYQRKLKSLQRPQGKKQS